MATKKQPRVDVKKTYKLFINGAFARSESGRVFEVSAKNGDFIANPALASRKDLRDAVTAARAAQRARDRLRGQLEVATWLWILAMNPNDILLVHVCRLSARDTRFYSLSGVDSASAGAAAFMGKSFVSCGPQMFTL
jgi:hypothetical protein